LQSSSLSLAIHRKEEMGSEDLSCQRAVDADIRQDGAIPLRPTCGRYEQ
jgi:hypothetical protein